ncbi:MAG: hypothetical protein U0T84_11725 [Chitinophagales bacterium]
MHFFDKIIAVALLLCTVSCYAGGEVARANGLNGQTYLVTQQASGNNLFVEAWFRGGPLYEFDSVSGISAVVQRAIDAQVQQAIPAKANISYQSVLFPDQFCFRFQGALSDLDPILKLIKEQVAVARFDEAAVQQAISAVNNYSDTLPPLEREIGRTLWQGDFHRMMPQGDGETYKRLHLADVRSYHSRYFQMINSSVSVTGDLNPASTLNMLVESFRDFGTNPFNPEQIVRVIQFKPVVNYVQLLDNKSGKTKIETRLIYQNPGARQDRNGSFCGFILSQLINDKSGVFQQQLTGTEFSNLRAQYDCGNFYGTFTLSVTSDSRDFMDQFDFLRQIVQQISQKSFWKDGFIEVAAHNIANEISDYRKANPHWYVQQLARYRFVNDEMYFANLGDSLGRINAPMMDRYVQNYFVNRAGVRVLETPPGSMRNVMPEQQYFKMEKAVEDITFHYDQNKTDLEGDTNTQQLLKLIQWLKVNPDNHVQINGFADESEFKKANDSYVMRFLDSTPTFRKVMPETIKKGYLRIEMMRAVKIAKLLYEAGIDINRLSGTSMVFTSENEKEEAGNRKCTVTIEKILPRPSLYEYHFGKPNEVTNSK